ncbi:heavy-metal-associated domain-containing protein [Amycolatopsis sp. NPDC098790]|uniref:heavy-metal-associated domain-containing protein n=1 Tax=Amycolatopsis sp. NPDC098790 TaxID=3363939 RepID=UPI00382F091B
MATVTYVFRVEGSLCGSCGLLVDETLEDLPGVRAAQSTVKVACSPVELDPGQAGPGEVIAAIAELGYVATVESAGQ